MERHMTRKPTKIKVVESGSRGAAGRRCKVGSGVHLPGAGVTIPGSGVTIPGSGVHIPGSGVHIRGGGLHFKGAGVHIRGSGAFEKPHMKYGDRFAKQPY